MKTLNTVVAGSLTSVLSLVAIAPGVYADTDSHSMAHVYVSVVSNISVQTLTSIVSLGDIQVGDISGTLGFRVDANMEAVALSVQASKLYKGSDPTNIEVAPIDFDAERGATYNADNANPLQGASNVAPCSLGQRVVNVSEGMEFYTCDSIFFESSQDGHFSQDVEVELHWVQNDPEKTTGEYGGYVYFMASILDDDIGS